MDNHNTLEHIFLQLQLKDLIPNVALVCKRWKEVIYTSRTLWNSVSFDETSLGLRRYECQSEYHGGKLRDLLQVPVLQNTEHLYLDLPIEDHLADVIPDHLPNLITLSLKVNSISLATVESLLENLPRLTSLRIISVDYPGTLSHKEFGTCITKLNKQFKHLTLNVKRHKDLLNSIEHLLQRCQSLKVLAIRNEPSWEHEMEEMAQKIIEKYNRNLLFLNINDAEANPFYNNTNVKLFGTSPYPKPYPDNNKNISADIRLSVQIEECFQILFQSRYNATMREYLFKPFISRKRSIDQDDITSSRLLERIREFNDKFEKLPIVGMTFLLICYAPDLYSAISFIPQDLWKRFCELLNSRATVMWNLKNLSSLSVLKWFPGCYVQTWSSNISVTELMSLVRAGHKFSWIGRGLRLATPTLNIRSKWLVNRMIWHLFDRLWDKMPLSIKNQPPPLPQQSLSSSSEHDDIDDDEDDPIEEDIENDDEEEEEDVESDVFIDESTIESVIRSVLGGSLYSSYSALVAKNIHKCPIGWSLYDDDYQVNQHATRLYIRSVDLALSKFGNFSRKAVFLVTCYLEAVIEYVDQRWQPNQYKSVFKTLRENPELDSLFWNMPLENSFWSAFSPELDSMIKPRNYAKHLRFLPNPYTKDQLLLLEQENHLRRLLIEQPNHEQLSYPFFGLVNVYENPALFRCDPLDDEEKRIPLLFESRLPHYDNSDNNSSIVSKEEFDKCWNELAGNSFNGLNWNNIYIAGGAILGALNRNGMEQYKNSDIDLFLYGMDEMDAKEKLSHILSTISNNHNGAMKIFRSKHSITIVRGYPLRHIQIVLRLYKSPGEILLGFDIDCCSVGYDGITGNVHCTRRCIRSLNKGYNLVNPTRRSTTYEYRLYKYSQRGFAVMIPCLDGSKIDISIYGKHTSQVNGLAKLLLYDYDPRSEMVTKRGTIPRKRTHDKYDVASVMELENTSDYAMALPFGPHWTLTKTSEIVRAHNWKHWHQRKGHSYYVTVHNVVGSQQEWGDVTNDIIWLTKNPGQQTFESIGTLMTGSFQPLSSDTWECDAYGVNALDINNLQI